MLRHTTWYGVELLLILLVWVSYNLVCQDKFSAPRFLFYVSPLGVGGDENLGYDVLCCIYKWSNRDEANF